MARKPKKPYSEMTYREKYMVEYKQFYDRWKRIEKRGYKLEERFQPNIPQKIGLREYERIKKKNSLDYIYDKATFYDMESDRYVSGKRGIEIERSRAGKKGARTRKERQQEKENKRTPYEDGVLREVEYMIEQTEPTHTNPHGKSMLQNLLFEQIANKGRQFVAERFQAGAPWVIPAAERVLRDSKQEVIQANFNAILVLLNERALDAREMQRYYDAYVDEGWN